MTTKTFILMGISGCGKTTVATALATSLGYTALDADDYHDEDSKALMSQGIGLTDEQRWPWLHRVSLAANQCLLSGTGVVLACSALKRTYRQFLSEHIPNVQFVWLNISQDTVRERLAWRKGHYANESLLASQFAALEIPQNEANVLELDADQSEADIQETLMAELEEVYALR